MMSQHAVIADSIPIFARSLESSYKYDDDGRTSLLKLPKRDIVSSSFSSRRYYISSKFDRFMEKVSFGMTLKRDVLVITIGKLRVLPAAMIEPHHSKREGSFERD